MDACFLNYSTWQLVYDKAQATFNMVVYICQKGRLTWALNSNVVLVIAVFLLQEPFCTQHMSKVI